MTVEVAPWDSPAPAQTADATPEVAPWDSPAPATSTAAPPEETAGRVAGLGARALAKGAAGTAGSVVDLANPIGKGVELAQTLGHAIKQKLGWEPTPAPPPAAQGEKPEPKLSDFIDPNKWGDAVDYLSDKAGLPKPATPGERVASSAVGALPSAALAPEAPIAGAVTSALGGAGSQIAAEKGAGPIGQAAAGMAAGSLPAVGAGIAATTRGLTRGASGANMQSRLADAAASGEPTLTVGQASGNVPLQYGEGVLSRLWGGGRFEKTAHEQTEDLGDHVQSIVDQLSGANVPSPTTAGTAVTAGIATTKGNMRAAEDAAYATRDKLVPPTTPTDLTRTLAALDKHGAPIPNAEPITAVVPKQISELRDQVFAAAAQNSPQLAGNFRPQIPYQAATALKTKIGNMAFSPGGEANVKGAMKDIWGALNDDLGDTASRVSPQAAAAAKSASSLYASNQQKRNLLKTIITKNGGPEQVYQAATNATKQGATKIQGVMNALGPDQQNLLRATFLSRMGRVAKADGSNEFSPGAFLKAWNPGGAPGGLSPNAKDALFPKNGPTGQLRSNLDSLSNTIGNIQRGTKLRNPAGTGNVITHSAGILAAWEAGLHLLGGNLGAAAGVAAGTGLNIALSRALTNPSVSGWLARSTKLPRSMIPNAINQLGKMNDPDAQALYQALNEPPPIARASGGKVDIDSLVNRLMTRWKSAKKESNKITEPLLKIPDDTIHKALHIAQRHI